MMQSQESSWRKYLIELFIVTLGILIGFGLNNWNESRKEKNKVDLYLKGIKEELLANKKELDKLHPYHLELLQKLNSSPNEVNLELKTGELSNSAWKLAENAIFKKHVNPEVYAKLAAVYKTHDGLIEHSSHAGNLMTEANVLGVFYLSPMADMNLSEEDQIEFAEQARKGWIPVFEDWTNLENDYLDRIEKAMGVLE